MARPKDQIEESITDKTRRDGKRESLPAAMQIQPNSEGSGREAASVVFRKPSGQGQYRANARYALRNSTAVLGLRPVPQDEVPGVISTH